MKSFLLGKRNEHKHIYVYRHKRIFWVNFKSSESQGPQNLALGGVIGRPEPAPPP